MLPSNLKNNSANGDDNINVNAIKISKLYICTPLEHIFNICFQTGIFPDQMKLAIITSIFKNGDQLNPGNYRPISLLSHFSKLFEKCIKSRLYAHMDVNNVLSPNQFGFRPRLSTNDATYKLTSELYGNLDKGQKSLAIYLDLAKAFDTVDHTKLLIKLEHLGIRGLPLELFRNYLSQRYQCVKIGSILSKKRLIKFGVPQGTVLGPILFIIYINDLCDLNVTGNLITYADDTVLICEGRNWSEAYENANQSLKLVYSWLNSNSLTLNKTKTVYIYHTINSRTEPGLEHTLQLHSFNCNTNKCSCYKIEAVENVKYLGITIDKNLKWKAHINLICKKTQNLSYIFYRLRNIISRTSMLTVYKALAQTVFQYGIIGWGGAGKTKLEQLITVQKMLIKIILKEHRLFSTAKTFEISGLLDIRQLFMKSILIYLKNNIVSFKKQCPVSQGDGNADGLNTRSTNMQNLAVPMRRTLLGQQSIDFIGPHIYNQLPFIIKNIDKIYVYKYEVNNWILSRGNTAAIKLIYL